MPPSILDSQRLPHLLRVDRYAANTLGRDLLVGDVHGAFSRLKSALHRIRFDESVDRLFCVGDLVDRGPESHEALEWLTAGRIRSVLGNHELAGLEFVCGALADDIYALNGGEWNIGVPPEVRQSRAGLFAQLPVAIEIETASGLVGLVHADVPAPSWDMFRRQLRIDSSRPPSERPTLDAAVNSRRRFRRGIGTPVAGVHAVVVGHTRVSRPTWHCNVLCIETGGWSDGDFAIVDAATLAPGAPGAPVRPDAGRMSVQAEARPVPGASLMAWRRSAW